MTTSDTPEPALAALRRLADSLGAAATDEQLERALPIVTRVLKNELSPDELIDLGEVEPTFGLRYDRG